MPWTAIAAAGVFRLGLLPGTVVYLSGGGDYITELNLSTAPGAVDNSAEAVAGIFRVWLIAIVLADLFLLGGLPAQFAIVFRLDPPLGMAVILLHALLFISIAVFCLGIYGDSIGDYTIEGPREEIDSRWRRKALLVKRAMRGLYLWVGGMFCTTGWLYLIHHNAVSR